MDPVLLDTNLTSTNHWLAAGTADSCWFLVVPGGSHRPGLLGMVPMVSEWGVVMALINPNHLLD